MTVATIDPAPGANVPSTDCKELNQQKEVAYYSALVSAWIETRMEFDKSLVMLSAGGIGLLVTILSTVGASSKRVLLFYFCAFFSFLLCIVSCLVIFNRNTKLIESLIGYQRIKDYRLSRMDVIALTSFLTGILFSISIGVIAGFEVTQSNQRGEDRMAAKTLQLKGRDIIISDSLDGIENLKPTQQREPDVDATPPPSAEETSKEDSLLPLPSNEDDRPNLDPTN